MAPRWMVVSALLAVAPAIALADEATRPAGVQRAASASRSVDARSEASRLRGAVHDALRQEATSRGAARDAAVVELTRLYGQLGSDDKLPDSQRTQLRALVRTRLAATARKLHRELVSSNSGRRAQSDESARVARLPGKERTILSQQAPPRGGAPAAGANSPAQELIDLITSTIAPDTWDTNGGLGTIRFFSLGHLLVVRQTAEVHGQLADTIGPLRGN